MKFIEEKCSNCNEETIHRIFRRFGKKKANGAKQHKRTVIRCMRCQKRRIQK